MNAVLVRLILGPLFLVLTFAASAGGALATPACDLYTRTAQHQFAEAQRLGCGGGLPEWWNPGYDYHFNWCVGLPAGSLLPAQGTADRDAVLSACAGNCPTPWAVAGISGRYYPDAECQGMCDAMTSCTRARSAGPEGCLFCLD